MRQREADQSPSVTGRFALMAPRRTIRLWLTWLVVVAILPGILVAGFLVVASYGRERASRERDTIAMARALMQVVDAELKSVQTALQVLATSPLLASGDLAGFHRQAREAWRGRIGNNIVLADASGHQIVNTLRPFGEPLPVHALPDQLRRTLETGSAAISDVFIGPVAGLPLIAVEVPVLFEGKVLYALSTGILTECLGDILRRQNIPADWLAAIIDSTGTIAARTRSPEQFVGRKAVAPLVRGIVGCRRGRARGQLGRGCSHARRIRPFADDRLGHGHRHSDDRTGHRFAPPLGLNAFVAIALLGIGIASAQVIGQRISRSIRALTAPALSLGSPGPLSIPATEIMEVNEVGQALVKASQLIEKNAAERDRAELEVREMLVAKRAAESASQAKSQFLASLSHELRTPLNAISGFAQLLCRSRGTLMHERQIRYSQNIADASDQLKSIIDDILDLARIETGQLNMNCEALDCLEVMTDVHRTLEMLAKERGIMLTVDTSANLPLVRADRARIIQVLLNLGSNAIKYNIDGGWVLLAAYPKDDMVRFVVRDTGKGIPAARHPEIFEPFNRLGAEMGPEEGMGIGLAITRRLVRAMDGKIGFESVVGEGSKFWIDLPVAKEIGTTKARVPWMPFVIMGDRRCKVLYIEDKIPNVELVRSIIEDFNDTQFIDAQTVEDGVTIARSVKPDLVITDIHLPDGKGFDVLQRLREDPETAHIPVIALTADAMPVNMHNMRRLGFDHILTKPFKVPELLDLVRTTLKAA